MEFEKPSHEPPASPEPYGGDRAPTPYEPGEGCLATVVRVPVRIVVLVVVVPVRIVGDLLAVCGRALERAVLRPLGNALVWAFENVLAPVGGFMGRLLFVWLWVSLWRYLLVPLVTYGLVMPAVWIHQRLLTPLGHGLAWLAGFLGRLLFVRPWAWLWRYLVEPLVTYAVVLPLVWIHRHLLTPLGHGLARLHEHVLAPLGREIAAAFEVAWRIAGHISGAVGNALKRLAWNLVGRPASWCYGRICTPVGHAVRDGLWRPAKKAAIEAGRAAGDALRAARETVRQARRDAWRALVGGSPASTGRERSGRPERTLAGTTTVPGVAAEPEISLRKQG